MVVPCALLAVVVACERGDASARGPHADRPQHTAAFEPAMVAPAAFDARTVERSVVGTREATSDIAAPVALVLDHETSHVRVLALSDPIGDVALEIRSGRVEVVDDGARIVLLDEATAPRTEAPAGSGAEGSGAEASGENAGAVPPPGSPPVRTVSVADGCTRVTLTWTWPPDGPLDATWREDVWTLCAPDGLRGRSRSVRFPAGERTISWTR